MSHEDRLGPVRTRTALCDLLDRLRAEAPDIDPIAKPVTADVLARHLAKLRSYKMSAAPQAPKSEVPAGEPLRLALAWLKQIAADCE